MEKQVEVTVYDGRRYYRRPSERYFSKNGRILHRVVWEAHNGPIPDGYCIHHRDHNPANNDISNLQMMTYAEHAAHHKETSAHLHRTPAKLQHLEKIRPLTKAWHASPEGRQWHSEHGVKAWAERQSDKAVCSVCGEEYETFFPDRSRYCSPACGNHDWHRKHKRPSRYKAVPVQAPRKCEECGIEYQPTRNTKRSLCSTRCRNQSYARQKRAGASTAPSGI